MTKPHVGNDAFWNWHEFEGYSHFIKGKFRAVNLFADYYVVAVF
jgi:hypothetical protein